MSSREKPSLGWSLLRLVLALSVFVLSLSVLVLSLSVLVLAFSFALALLLELLDLQSTSRRPPSLPCTSRSRWRSLGPSAPGIGRGSTRGPPD